MEDMNNNVVTEGADTAPSEEVKTYTQDDPQEQERAAKSAARSF